MKMRKLHSGVLAVCLLLGLSSCLDDKGNTREQQGVPAVITSKNSSGLPYINIPDMAFYATEASHFPGFEVNDCGLIHYYIDFDNQSSGSYYTAEVREWTPLDSYNYEYSNILENENYTDTLLSAQLYSSVQRVLFLITEKMGTKDETFDFRWVYGPEISHKEAGKTTLYLQSAKSSADSTYRTQQISAFPIPSSAFRDTTVNGYNWKYASVDVKYQSRFDKEGVPVFKSISSDPYYIWELNMSN